MSYNLDEQTQEYFEFILGGHTYRMRYPTTEEVQEAQDKLKEKEDDIEEGLKWLYKLVEKTDESSPAIEDAVRKINIKKLRRFSEMVKTEFFGDE